MINKKDKRGVDLLNATVIFVLLNLIFFSAMFFFVWRVGSGASYYEQLYSKQIALMIDNSKPGTLISLNIEKLGDFAKKNNVLLEEIISLNNNMVVVKATHGKGYSFNYFSDYKIDKSFSKDTNGELILNLGISKNET
jgi:hypothetical protein